jgi:hypothetical protein
MKIIKGTKHANIKFKEEYKLRFNAPMFGYLTQKELRIYRTGLKNGVRLGRSSSKPKIKIIKATKPFMPNVPTYNVTHKQFVESIIRITSKFLKVSIADVLGKTRRRNVIIARSTSMNLVHELTNLPLITIGELIGNKDHTTVIYHIRSKDHNHKVWKHPSLHHNYEQIKKEINELHNK